MTEGMSVDFAFQFNGPLDVEGPSNNIETQTVSATPNTLYRRPPDNYIIQFLPLEVRSGHNVIHTLITPWTWVPKNESSVDIPGG